LEVVSRVGRETLHLAFQSEEEYTYPGVTVDKRMKEV
jgi:hypothetical protein